MVNFAGQEARVEVAPGADVAALQAAVDRLGYSATGSKRATSGRASSSGTPPRPATSARWRCWRPLFTIPAFLLTMFGPDQRWATVGRVGA